MHRPRTLLAIVGCAFAVTAAPVAAGDAWNPPVVAYLTTEPTTAKAAVDVAADGQTVAIVVARTTTLSDVDFESAAIAVSGDLGSSGSWVVDELPDVTAPRVDICPGAGVAFTGVTVIAGQSVVGAKTAAEDKVEVPAKSGTAQASRPDIACLGTKRIALAYLSTDAGSTTLQLRAYRPDLSAAGLVSIGLGKAFRLSTPAVAGTGARLYVAWVTGTQLRFKRYTVGGAPGFALAGSPTVTLDTGDDLREPRLAAEGGRVVLAWERGPSVVARVSRDKGVSFGARSTVTKGSLAALKLATLTGVDVAGPVLLVSTTTTLDGADPRGALRRSTDAGKTWATIPGSGQPWFVSGALSGGSGTTLDHMVLDQRLQGDKTVVDHLWGPD